MLRIHDILVWIRIWIRGSMPLTNGSGSCYFRHRPSRCQQKKVTNSRNQGVSYYFCIMIEGSRSGSLSTTSSVAWRLFPFRTPVEWTCRDGICKSLKDPRNRSQPGGPVQQPCLSYRPARLHGLAESIPRNRFLGSINIYKYGLRVYPFLPPTVWKSRVYAFTHSAVWTCREFLVPS